MSESVGVLGASGYVGEAIVHVLQKNGYDVRPAAGSAHDRYPTVDVRERAAIRSFVEGLDYVVNTAGVVGIDACNANPERALDVNATGAANVAWVCRQASVPLVHLSSVATIGEPKAQPITADSDRHPTTTYGRTKLLGERAVRTLAADRIPATSFCVTNVYGTVDGAPGGSHSVLDFFVDRGVGGETLTVHRPGTQERDLIHVRDVADAVVAAIDAIEHREPGSRSYVLGSGTAYSVLELAGLVASELAAIGAPVPAIELCDNPDSRQPTIDRFDVDTTAIESELGVAPAWTVREWISTVVDDRRSG